MRIPTHRIKKDETYVIARFGPFCIESAELTILKVGRYGLVGRLTKAPINKYYHAWGETMQISFDDVVSVSTIEE